MSIDIIPCFKKELLTVTQYYILLHRRKGMFQLHNFRSTAKKVDAEYSACHFVASCKSAKIRIYASVLEIKIQW